MNNENLKKGKATQFRSGEMAARNGSKGGYAKAKKDREMKAAREMMRELLQRYDEGEEMTEQEKMLCHNLRIAQGEVKGNTVEATKLVLKIAGEYVEQSELTVDAKETATVAIERVMKEIKQ